MNLAWIANRIEIAFWDVLIALLGKFSSRKRRSISATVLAGLAILGLIVLSLVASTLPSYLGGHERSSGQSLAIVADDVSQRPRNGQQNILIVLVDHLSDPAYKGGIAFSSMQPALEGVWLVAFVPGRAHLTFFPIYPFSMNGENAHTGELARHFSLEVDGILSGEFQQAIREQGVWWDKYLVLDRSSLAEVIELAGGVDLGYGRLSGAEITALMATVRQDPHVAIGLQAMLAQQVCRAGRYLYQKVDPGIMAGLILDGARSDLEMDGFIAGWLGLRDIQGGLMCEIP